MGRSSKSLLLAGATVLFVGLLLPWVKTEPPATQHNNISHLANLVSLEWLPNPIKEQLQGAELKPGITPEQIETSLLGGERPENASHLLKHQRLYVWNLLLLPSSFFTKVLCVLIITICLCAWLIVICERWFGLRQPAIEMEQEISFFDWTETAPYDRPPAESDTYLGLLTLSAGLVLLGFVWQMPFLDTLGFRGEWEAALLDIITGSRVAFAARLFVPLGLSLIFLSGVEIFLDWRFRSTAYSDRDTFLTD